MNTTAEEKQSVILDEHGNPITPDERPADRKDTPEKVIDQVESEMADEPGPKAQDIESTEPDTKKTSLWQRFKESKTGRRMIGEHISEDEVAKDSKKRKTGRFALKAADFASSVFGTRLLTRMPERTLKRWNTAKEAKAIKKQWEQSAATDHEMEGQIEKRTRIDSNIENIKTKIEQSKYLSPEKRAALFKKLAEIKGKWDDGNNENEQTLFKDIGHTIKEHVVQKTKKSELFRDTLNLAATASGFYAIRAVGMGATMLYERHQKLKSERKEGQPKINLFKDTIYRGAVETLQEIGGKGKLAELKGKEKRLGQLAAAMKPLLAGGMAAIAVAGYSEISEKGFGAFTRVQEQLAERASDISAAWDKVASSDQPAQTAKEIGNLILKTLNLRETFHRTTMNAFQAKEDAAEIAAAGVGANVATENLPPETAEALKPTPTIGQLDDESRKLADEASKALFPEETDKAGTTDFIKPKFDLSQTEQNIAQKWGLSLETQGLGTEPGNIFNKAAEAAADRIVSGIEPSAMSAAEIEALQQELTAYMQAGDTEGLSDRLNELVKQNIIDDSSSQSMVEIADAQHNANARAEIIPTTPEQYLNMKNELGAALQANDTTRVQAIMGQGVITPEEQAAIQAQVQVEQNLNINSYDQNAVTDEELARIRTLNKESAQALLDNFHERGLITPEQNFAATHGALDHAGFQAEAAADGKLSVTVELGQDGGPQHLEQAFYRLATDNMNAEQITNLEAARVLNMGANMRELANGGIIAGIDGSTEFAPFITIDGDQITINDFEQFQKVMNELQIHSENIITPDNLPECGATAYINDINQDTWTDMGKPDSVPGAASEDYLDFNDDEIAKAETSEFTASVKLSGTGEMATDIDATNQNNGTFNLAGQKVTVENGQVTSIGNHQLDTPVGIGHPDARATLLSHAMASRAEEILSDKPELIPIENQADQVAQPLVTEEQLAIQEKQTLTKLGFGKGQGVEEWKFLAKQPTDAFLRHEVEGYAGNQSDWLEHNHRGTLREFVNKAITDGAIKPPGAGGPPTVGEAMEQITARHTEAQIKYDLEIAKTVAERNETFEPAAAGPSAEAAPSAETPPPAKQPAGAENAAASTADTAPSLAELEQQIVHQAAAEEHFSIAAKGLEITNENLDKLKPDGLKLVQDFIKTQINELQLTSSVSTTAPEIREKIGIIISGYQHKLEIINGHLEKTESTLVNAAGQPIAAR